MAARTKGGRQFAIRRHQWILRSVPGRKPCSGGGCGADDAVRSGKDPMSLYRVVAAIGVMICPFAVACQGSPFITHHDSGGDKSSTAAPTSNAWIENLGWGGSGDDLWVTSIVRDVPVGQLVMVSFNLYGADGTLLGTIPQVERAINPGARIMVGTQVNTRGQPPARVEPTLQVSHEDPEAHAKFRDVVLQLGPVTLRDNGEQFVGTTAEAELTNPSDQQIPGARVGVACFGDQQGMIIGGGLADLHVVPAKGKVRVAARILTSGPPDHCEMAAQPSES